MVYFIYKLETKYFIKNKHHFMEIDKRPFYIWMVVLLANIGTVFGIVFSSGPKYIFESWNLIILGISLFVSVIPVLISMSNSRLKNRFGYGIPFLLLLPLPYFVYDYYTCTAKFCQIAPIIFGFSFSISAVIFALFYAIGIYAKKWTVKFVLSLIWIEIILLVGSVLYFVFNGFN